MSERWKLTVKGMTGHLIHVDIADPQVCCFPMVASVNHAN